MIPTLRGVRHLRPSMEAIFNGINQGLSENEMLEMEVFKGVFDMFVDQRIIFNGGKKGLDSYHIDKKELNKFGVQDDDQTIETHDSKLGGDIPSDFNFESFFCK